MKIPSILAFIITMPLFLCSCGAPEDQAPTPTPDFTAATTTTGGALQLAELSPHWEAFNRVQNSPNALTPDPTRQIAFNLFQRLVEPQLSLDKQTAQSFITGIGLDASDLSAQHVPLKITLGIVAREYDSETNRFRPVRRIFSAPGTTFENAQRWEVGSDEHPNFVLTGLGLQLREGRMVNLVLQRKSLSEIYDTREIPETSTVITLDPGWAAVGIIIRVSPAKAGNKIPFIQDLLMFSAELRAM